MISNPELKSTSNYNIVFVPDSEILQITMFVCAHFVLNGWIIVDSKIVDSQRIDSPESFILFRVLCHQGITISFFVYCEKVI